MPRRAELLTHRLINRERKRRRLSPVRWSPVMYHFAKSHSRKMAKAGRLFHTRRFALQGGENICGGKGHHSPRDFVKSWMDSPEHRAWLLSPKVQTAAVGISRSRRGTYAAWSFSAQPIPWPRRKKRKRLRPIGRGITGWLTRLFSPYYVSLHPKLRPIRVGPDILHWLTVPLEWAIKLLSFGLAAALIVFGAHGIYVYFSRLEVFFKGDVAALFLSIQMPAQLQSVVEWMSIKGAQSWFIPAVFVALGIVLWYWLPRWLLRLV
jgi:hypothetical protein